MGEKHLLIQLKNNPIKYVLPAVFAVLATLTKICCFRYTGYSIPFLMYFMVALIAGTLVGFRGVLISLAAIALCIFIWLIPATNGRYTLSELIIFFVEGIGISVLFRVNELFIQKLNESEKKYGRIIDQSAEALLLCNNEGQITYASAVAFRLLLISKKELLSSSLTDFIHPDEKPQFDLVQLRLKIKGEGTALLLQKMHCGNDEWRWTECCINNLLNDPAVGSMVIQLRDITNRVNLEKHQEDFVNLASHELKSPITAIRGFLQIAIKRWNENQWDNAPEYLNRIQVQTDRLLTISDDMLNLTKIKAGELMYHFELMNIDDCLRETVEAVKASTPGRLVELCIEADLPKLKADWGRISQVFTNLLSNALKYSPGSAPVKAELYRKGDWIEIRVIDHGIGIPQDKLRCVFDRFYRVEGLSKGKYEGLGLGLFIAANIVRKHHGHIWVESDEGKGSVFYLTLPVT